MSWLMVAGGLLGFTFGTFFDKEVVASQVNALFIIFATFGAGFYANTGECVNSVV